MSAFFGVYEILYILIENSLLVPIEGLVVQEECDVHAEHASHHQQTLGANSVLAEFVLLNLLKCDANQLSQFLLAHPKQFATLPDAGSHELVERLGFFGRRWLGAVSGR
ncbi:MAG: hypothetical protein O9272_14215 [Brevundimonas sp.]|nr:hypothetical protein [Brevundimonas sp.]